MTFDIYASGTGRWHDSWTGVSVGEVLDAVSYMQYATSFSSSGAVTAIQQGGNYISGQMDATSGIAGNLTTLGARKLADTLNVLLSENPNNFHVAVALREHNMVLPDAHGFWEDHLRSYDQPYYTMMTGLRPILEETNLLCMGVLSGIADALAAWDKRPPPGNDTPRILIQITNNIF